MNKISVIGLDKKFKKFEAGIQGVALKILEILNKNGVEAEIYLIDGRKMRFLNKKFRGQDKTTTILSFEEPKNFILPPSKHKKIGEIYLNMTNDRRPTTNDSSGSLVVSRRLLVHGLLHLLGYDHQKKNDRIKMEKKEEYVHNRLRLRNISN
ncbi:MAG: rRNA maturation RNase YbeY [Patescibacteria group bacterium]